jgi:hypothetical protein
MRYVVLAAVLLTSPSWAAGSSRRPMPTPPYILMYGFYGQILPYFDETLGCVNIVSVTWPTDAAILRQVRERGVMVAQHVNAASQPGRETAEELADYWCTALENDLGGGLPGGFDAIAIDEIGESDGTPESARICTALRLTRERCPDGRIFVWGKWNMGEGGTFYDPTDDELRAVSEYADLFMLEEYICEANVARKTDAGFDMLARAVQNIQRRVPEVLYKTVLGLNICSSAHETFVGDNSDAADFKDCLDEQFHLLVNEPLLRDLPGVAFYSFSNARPDVIAHVNALIRHYYQQRRTDYYGDGDWRQIVRNPGFEDDGAWELASSEGGDVRIVQYAAEPGAPDRHGLVSHGKRCLRMVRGATPNEARQTLSLKPRTWYTLTAYCHLPNGRGRPLTCAADAAGRPVETRRGQTRWGPWVTPAITFKTGADGTTVIVLTDEDIPEGSKTYWDFVEIEECRGINRPTVLTKATFDPAARQIALEGDNFMPGSTLTIDRGEPLIITWLRPTRASVAVPADLEPGTHDLVLAKPTGCLHPHEASLRVTL